MNHGTKMSGAACDLLIGLNARTLQCAEPPESPRSLIMQVLSSSAGGIDDFSRTTRSFQDSPPYVLFSCPLLFALTEVSSGPDTTYSRNQTARKYSSTTSGSDQDHCKFITCSLQKLAANCRRLSVGELSRLTAIRSRCGCLSYY